MPMITCEVCGKKIYRQPCLIKKQKHIFCSMKCKGDFLREKPNLEQSKRLKQLYKEGKIIHPFLGKHHSEETKKIIRLKNKGRISWCKNLTKETDERVRRQGEKESETKKRLYAEGKLIPIYPKGVKLSEEIIRKRVEGRKRKGSYKAWNKDLTKADPRVAKNFQSGNYLKGLKIGWESWQNPEFRERVIEAQLKGSFKRPTSLEKKFTEFIQKNGLPFKYCGNGSLLIGFKSPDFFESNGKKLCMEVGNKIEKSIKRKTRNYHSWQEYEQQRITHFAKYGWKCLVIWEDELKDEQSLLTKINNFIGN